MVVYEREFVGKQPGDGHEVALVMRGPLDAFDVLEI